MPNMPKKTPRKHKGGIKKHAAGHVKRPAAKLRPHPKPRSVEYVEQVTEGPEAQAAESSGRVPWMKAARRGFRFCVWPQRWLPFFAADAAALVSVLLIINAMAPTSMIGFSESPVLSDIAPYLLILLFAVGVVWGLVSILISGALIHQSRSPKEFMQSWKVSLNRYPTLLAAAILVGIMSILVSFIPYIGFIFSISISIMFIFVNQSVILDKTKVLDALSLGAKAFRRRTGRVIVAWAINTCFTLLILAVFALPLIITYGSFVLQYGGTGAMVYMLMYLDPVWLYLEGGIFMLGLAISKTYGTKFLTEIYMEFQKRKLLSF